MVPDSKYPRYVTHDGCLQTGDNIGLRKQMMNKVLNPTLCWIAELGRSLQHNMRLSAYFGFNTQASRDLRRQATDSTLAYSTVASTSPTSQLSHTVTFHGLTTFCPDRNVYKQCCSTSETLAATRKCPSCRIESQRRLTSFRNTSSSCSRSSGPKMSSSSLRAGSG